MAWSRSKSAAAAMFTLGLAGCAAGPNFHSPPPPTAGGYTPDNLPATTATAPVAGGGAQRFVEGLDIPGQWWLVFHSAALNALVDRALKANPDMQSAQAALRVAREAYLAQRGALFPSVDVSYNISRQKTPDVLAPLVSSNSDLFTLHTAQVTVSYTADVFGAVRRQTESVHAQADSQRFQTEATYLTLTSNLVAAAIQEASLRDQIAATKEIIAADQQVLHLMGRELAAGEIDRSDVAAQQAAVAQAQQTLPPLEKQLAVQRDLIADLTGDFPSQASPERVDFDALSLPRDLPVSLPSRLVEQRPDVRAANANLHVASALVGVAVANRLPNFVLTANGGAEATNFADLFRSANSFYALAGAVTQPIFQGGALRHKERQARAAYDQADAQYRSAVLAAFQNVADSLQALEADARGLVAAVASEASTSDSLAIARRQLALGQVGALPVLNAQQAYQQSILSRVQAQASRYADTAALFQALGGGWWNRQETTADAH